MSELEKPKPAAPGEEGYIDTDNNEGGDLTLPRFMSEQGPKSKEEEYGRPVTGESMVMEEHIESLEMQLDDLKNWFSVILGKDNVKMSHEEKLKLALETDRDLAAIRTKFFEKTK